MVSMVPSHHSLNPQSRNTGPDDISASVRTKSTAENGKSLAQWVEIGICEAFHHFSTKAGCNGTNDTRFMTTNGVSRYLRCVMAGTGRDHQVSEGADRLLLCFGVPCNLTSRPASTSLQSLQSQLCLTLAGLLEYYRWLIRQDSGDRIIRDDLLNLNQRGIALTAVHDIAHRVLTKTVESSAQ